MCRMFDECLSKIMIMKKLFTLLFVLSIAQASRATLTFTLLTAPCDTNGVLVFQYTGFSLPPFHAHWIYGTRTADHTFNGFTDTLRNYNGAPLTQVVLYDSTGTQVDTGSFAGTPPLYFAVAGTTAVCPAKPTVTATAYGTGPFTYTWYDMGTGAIVGTGGTLTVPSGNYGVWITDGSGCASGTPATGLSENVVTSVAFTDALTSVDASCTNGSATVVSVSGSYSNPISYHWSNGATSKTIDHLTSGFYYVTVSDSAGCSLTSSVYIYQTVTMGATTSVYGTSCAGNDGGITAHPSGGLAPYTFLWDNGFTSASQTNLTPGTYSVIITDMNGCTGTGSGTVTGSTPIHVIETVTPSLCTAATGVVALAISGGTAPYKDSFYSSPLQTSALEINLPKGLYFFKITDAHNCMYNGSVNVPGADSLGIDFTSIAATCNLANGTLNAYPYGGAAPYSYTWNTGTTASVIAAHPAGTYTVTVSDGNGCSATKAGTISEYNTFDVNLSTTPASCMYTHDGVVNANPAGGTPPYTYAWSTGGATQNITFEPTGNYWVTVTDAAGCTATGYSYLGYNRADSNCYCVIKGMVYHDANADCSRQATEQGIKNVQVYCSGIGYTYTDDSGMYSFMVPTGTYTVTETVQTYFPLTGCQPNNIVVGVIADSGCVHEVDFANVYDTLHDVQITTWDFNQPVAGQPYSQISIIYNGGSNTENAPAASAKTDPQVYNATFIPSGTYGNSPAYDYSTLIGSGLQSLTPGQSQSFMRNFNVPGYLANGTYLNFYDTLAYIAPLDSWITDFAPWNNVYTLTTQVVASSAANFKEVSPKGIGSTGLITLNDSNLQYMIHFQNTGNYTAENVVIIDTLDNNLNWASFSPVYSMLPCTITTSANGQIVKFTFNHIELPTAAANSFASNAMVSYNIKLKSGLTYGNQIRNNASVYYDYNAPVKTNTTLNTIGWTLGTEQVVNDVESFTIYPNPAGSYVTAAIHAETAGSATMLITDLAGRTLLTQQISMLVGANNIRMDVSNLPSGIYLILLNNGGKIQTRKLSVIR